MKQVLLILTLIFFSIKGFSTHQTEDYVIIDKDTLYFNELQGYVDSPLEQIDSISEKIRKNLNRDVEIMSSGCWRGFYAEWKIIDNTLYLSKVFDCHTHELINDVVEKSLGRKFTDGLLEANWVNGTFSCGRDLIYSLYLAVYKYNLKFVIKKGQIVSREVFINNEKNPFDD